MTSGAHFWKCSVDKVFAAFMETKDLLVYLGATATEWYTRLVQSSPRLILQNIFNIIPNSVSDLSNNFFLWVFLCYQRILHAKVPLQ